MVRTFVARMDAEPGWSAATSRIRSEGDDTLIEGLAVTRKGKPLAIRADRIRLPQLAPQQGGGFWVESANVTGFALETPTLTIAAPDASATALAAPDLLGVPYEPDRLMVLLANLWDAREAREGGSPQYYNIIANDQPDDIAFGG